MEENREHEHGPACAHDPDAWLIEPDVAAAVLAVGLGPVEVETPEALSEIRGLMGATAPVVPKFFRVLRAGMTGEDVLFLRRCLARAGHGTLVWTKIAKPMYFGPYLTIHLKAFQKKRGLLPDGIMGYVTFKALLVHADSRATWHLSNAIKAYKPPPPPVPVAPQARLVLPQWFRWDHQTGGLWGYPAKDFFAPAGSTVGAPEDGTVHRLTGRDPSLRGKPGGAYGYGMFLRGNSGADYFLTHFMSRSVWVGAKVRKGQVIGRVCDARVAWMAPSASHIHQGKRG